MLVPPTEGLRVAKYAEGAGYAPDQWARALAGVDWEKAQLLSDKPTSSVWRAELVVQKRLMTLVIKCEPIDRLKRKLQKLMRKTHAFRHWRGTELLMKHGFRTAEPKAIVYGKRDGVELECLIMEAVQGETLLRHLASGDLGVGEEHAVARLLGAQMAALDNAGLRSRDHKLSNILLSRAPEGVNSDRTLVIIDCVGLSKGPTTPEDLLPAYHESAGVGARPRLALVMRALTACLRANKFDEATGMSNREVLRGYWNVLAQEIRSHGDPTPEHNPLGLASETSPERE